jgi:selenocysteine lyase/cysteine desulfurase
MDVRRFRIDFLAADGHKWMCGPEGASIFFVAKDKLEQLDVIEHGWTNIERRGKFIDCPDDLLPDSRRFEAGSLNTNGIYGLRASLELLLETGIDTIAEYVVALASRFAERLEGIGWRVASPRPIRSAIIGATPPGVEPSLLRWHRLLEENGVVCAPREGMLRLSPHLFNEDAEVDKVIELLARA